MLKYSIFLFIISLQVNANTHHPAQFLQSIDGSKNEGEQIYLHFCVNCHATKPLIPLGAPRIGEEDDWKLRLKQGMEILFQRADEGINAMPPRGGCFECTDQQLMKSILFMLPESALKKPIK